MFVRSELVVTDPDVPPATVLIGAPPPLVEF